MRRDCEEEHGGERGEGGGGGADAGEGGGVVDCDGDVLVDAVETNLGEEMKM
jgi:hypothetical protein